MAGGERARGGARRGVAVFAVVVAVASAGGAFVAQQVVARARIVRDAPPPLYQTSDACIACHNGLTTPAGEDVSIGNAWRATMMANSARDPYWQAAVRREIMDHPGASEDIQNECATCHMPMMASETHLAGGEAPVFANLPVASATTRAQLLAADGVSCTTCHQMSTDGLGDPATYNGRFRIDTTRPWGARPVYGRHAVDSGRVTIMHSASEFVPTQGLHVQRSEMCASCHTLFTNALDTAGAVVGRFAEQVPYLEWQASAFGATRSCQACHMPVVSDSMPISGVWGQQRAGLARHEFLGGNFFVLDMLNRYRDELGVTATPAELERSVARTKQHLADATARVTVSDVTVSGTQVRATVAVRNLAGHKFPTAYPSRRAWLHVVVRDASGRSVFESGAPRDDGSIAGNDNDENAATFEPHHAEIRRPTEVQIYESVIADAAGRVTTGLMSAVRYVKDNRLLPDGFDKQRASADVAVHGEARADADFVAGSDAVRYVVDVSPTAGPFSVVATLMFQPIAYRWAVNLGTRSAPEIERFTAYYRAMAPQSFMPVARDSARTR